MSATIYREPLPSVTVAERKSLLARHWRRDARYDEATDEYLPLAIPECAECGEIWGRDGCSTVRVVVLLGHEERERAAANLKVKELTSALNKIAVRGHWSRVDGAREVEIKLRVVDFVLEAAGIVVIDETLAKMRREIGEWWKQHRPTPEIQSVGEISDVGGTPDQQENENGRG